ncbi:MAG: hypothetical protein QXL02_03090 [Candidatus Anstonellales archaeon]
MMSIKLYKYMRSGETLANIIDRIKPISQEERDRLIDFVMDLGRADEIVERIVQESDPKLRKALFNSTRDYIKKYLELGYCGVFELFKADLDWNRNRTVRNSILLSKAIYKFISNNIVKVHDRRLEALIITSNLLDDLFDVRKDGNLNFKYILGLIGELIRYSYISSSLIFKNLDLLCDLLVNVKYVFRGGFEDETIKNADTDISKLIKY